MMITIEQDVQKALESSMLQRVPDLAITFMQQGMSDREALNAAIIKARDIEDHLAAELMDAAQVWRNNEYAVSERQSLLVERIDGMCRRIWTNAQPV